MSWAGASGNSDKSTVDADEMDYTLTYSNSVYEGDATQLNYSAWFRYYDYTDMATNDADAQELAFAVSMPNLCPGGIVPSYAYIQMWNAEGGGAASGLAGAIHVVGLSYALAVDGLEQPLDLGFDATFNDGAGAGGGVVDHDWSHITWSIGTSMQVGDGVLTPTINYQTSMEDTVNPEDEFYTGISYSIAKGFDGVRYCSRTVACESLGVCCQLVSAISSLILGGRKLGQVEKLHRNKPEWASELVLCFG